MLSRIVYEVVQANPDGLKHSEVVQEVLRRGYKHQGNTSLSAAIYGILKDFVTCGAIRRTEDESLVRRYNCAECPEACLKGMKCPHDLEAVCVVPKTRKAYA